MMKSSLLTKRSKSKMKSVTKAETPSKAMKAVLHPRASTNTIPFPVPVAWLGSTRSITHRATSSFPSKRPADFLNFTRPAPFSTTYSKVHSETTGVAILEQLERLDAVEVSVKKLGSSVGGDNSGNGDCEVDVAVSPISPITRNGRPLGSVSAPGRMSRSSRPHTHNNDHGVPPMMNVSFSGPFSPGRIPDGLPRWQKRRAFVERVRGGR